MSLVIVRPSIPERDSNLVVVEVAPIQLEELHDKRAEVLCRIDLPSPYLRMHLQKANSQTDDTVASEASSENFVHASLIEERLDDEHQSSEGRKLLHELLNDLPGCTSFAIWELRDEAVSSTWVCSCFQC